MKKTCPNCHSKSIDIFGFSDTCPHCQAILYVPYYSNILTLGIVMLLYLGYQHQWNKAVMGVLFALLVIRVILEHPTNVLLFNLRIKADDK